MTTQPKTIKCHGLTLRLNSDGRYRTDNLKFSTWKLSSGVWKAHVITNDVSCGEANTPQRAIDCALNEAIKVIDLNIKFLSKQKKAFLKLKLGA